MVGSEGGTGGRHHYNSFEYGIATGNNGGGGGQSGGGGGSFNGLPGVIGSSNAVTRKPIFYGKTDVRGGPGTMDNNNDITSKASGFMRKMSIAPLANVWQSCWWCCCLWRWCCWPFHDHHWPYLIVLLSVLYSLITTTTPVIFFNNLL